MRTAASSPSWFPARPRRRRLVLGTFPPLGVYTCTKALRPSRAPPSAPATALRDSSKRASRRSSRIWKIVQKRKARGGGGGAWGGTEVRM